MNIPKNPIVALIAAVAVTVLLTTTPPLLAQLNDPDEQGLTEKLRVSSAKNCNRFDLGGTSGGSRDGVTARPEMGVAG